MPRSKPKPAAQPAQPPSTSNGPVVEVLTLTEAAAYLRSTERDVIHATSTQGLPGRLVGGEWRFSKSAIVEWLGSKRTTAALRKDAQLAAAGAFQEDPDLIRICEEAYRARGRPITEDGSFNVLHGLEPEE